MGSFQTASATAIALTVISGGCVVLRLLARLLVVKHAGPDDCLIGLAWAASLALAIVTRQHASSSPTDTAINDSLLRQLWSSNITYNLAVLLLKDALLFQYLRFSIDIGYRRACWALGCIITAYGLAALFVGIFSCQPIAYSWDSSLQGAKCIDFLAFWLFNASFNSATDIIVCVLPIPILRALQLPRKQLVILSLVFALGVFVCIASILRLVAVYTATVQDQNDPAIATWSTVEVNIGIVCACLPSLRHLVTQFGPRVLAMRRGRKSTTESHPPSPPSLMAMEKAPLACMAAVTDEPRRHSDNSDTSCSNYSTTYSNMSSSSTAYMVDLAAVVATPAAGHAQNRGRLMSKSSHAPLVDNDAILAVHTVSVTDAPRYPDTGANEKPLPPPPFPAIPPPAARPSGPRPQTAPNRPPLAVSSSSSSRHHHRRATSRGTVSLACIPESQSWRSSSSSAIAFSDNIPDADDVQKRRTDQAGGQTPPSQGNDHDHRFRPTSALASSTPVNPPPPCPASPSSTYTTISTMSSDKSLLGNIAPWDSSPYPAHKTYSYEVRGGPGALEDKPPNPRRSPKSAKTTTAAQRPFLLPAARSLGSGVGLGLGLGGSKWKREQERRDQERTRRKEREHQREADRLRDREDQVHRREAQGERPRGPREMTSRSC